MMMKRLLPRSMGRLNSSFSTKPSSSIRHDWSKQEIQDIYDMPFLDLVNRAANVHREHFNSREVQQCTLLSIKTGGCVEDCKYCSQSAAHKTFVKPTPTMKVMDVVEMARRAKEAGSTRFCMGAAWRDVGENKDRKAFSSVLEMVRQVNGMGLEVCCTLGMLNESQAMQVNKTICHIVYIVSHKSYNPLSFFPVDDDDDS
jgi:biotin synthase